MATSRVVSRLLPRRSFNTPPKRGYADKMRLTFCAGNQMFHNGDTVRQVDVPSFSGCFGILAEHVPTLAILRPGVVTVFEDDGSERKIFVSSGTVTVNADSTVQILAEEAHPIENLDSTTAKEMLSKAQSLFLSATTDEDKVEAQIGIEVGEALVEAL
ncbi:hypothetical protein NQ318_000854, partial [Aromia moschata]